MVVETCTCRDFAAPYKNKYLLNHQSMNFFSSIITDLRDKIIIHIDDLDLISPFFIYYFLSIVFVSLLIKELMGYHVCSN